MSHAHDAILKDLAGRLPVRPNARKRQIWMACIAIGLVSFVMLFLANPTRAWASYTINLLFWLGIAEAGVVLASAIRLANGRWGGPIMRVAESLSAFLPYGLGLMVLLLVVGLGSYMPWVSDPSLMQPRQAAFLNVPFLIARTLGGILLFWWLARKLVHASLRGDAQLLKPHVAAELKPAYDKLTAGWRGDEEEARRYRHEVAHLSPQLVLVFVASFTVMGWDFVMALTPLWVSALFGWWFWAAAFVSGVAMTAFLAGQVRGKYGLEAYIKPNHFWDTGKILFSFCIFWVYLFWSQYLPIWYANMPEETGWVFLRFEHPWRFWGFLVFFLIFAIPFLALMNKATKSSPFWLGTFALIVMSGVWLERHVLVMPSLNPDTVWIGAGEVGLMIGFLGLFGWAVQGFLTKYPCVKVVDVLAQSGGHGH